MIPPATQRSSTAAADDDGTPGLPGFRTWRGVYLFVFGCFAAWVGLLTLLTRLFS